MKKCRNIDLTTTLFPFVIILSLCIYFILYPAQATNQLNAIRAFLGDELGSYYLLVGLAVFIVSMYLAFSRIGNIRLGGKEEKPQYSFWAWGAMLFTAGLAADILFYSLCEWIYYAGEPRISELGTIQDWASAYPLFHWGPIPWSFYATLAASFGFMLHIRGVKKRKYSEACRPLLGKMTDKLPGKLIDLLAVFALIAGTATTFGVATPLLTASISELTGIEDTKWVTIAILIVICVVYTVSVMRGMRGVSFLANLCMYAFMGVMLFVLLFGGQTRYIIETGITAIGNVTQNFISLATWTDPLRTSGFPQNWTIFYWAYWMVWCVAAPFFMGTISKGRTVRQVILGAYGFGVCSTYLSFIILGNYGLGMQMNGRFDAVQFYQSNGNLYQTVMQIVKLLPSYQFFLILLIIAMIAFYATSFDSITLVAATYSYKELQTNEKTSRRMNLFWAILLILLPIALIFSEGSMSNMQTVSIIAAFPIAIVIGLIIISFIKDAKRYLKE